MTWIKLANNFPSHPKVLMAGPEGAWLFVCGLCYANEYLTDGYIPAGAVAALAPGLKHPDRAAKRLLDAGLWGRAELGWQVHDYGEWQRSSEQILQRRRADAERKRLGLRTESDGTPDGVHDPRGRAGPRAPSREVEVEVEVEVEGPPVVPPRGGRRRDHARWEKDVDAYAEEHFPQLPRPDRVRAVRQAFKFGKAETPQQVTAFIREHFPDLAGQLGGSS